MGFGALQTAPQANAGKHSSRFQLLIGECVLEPVARGERLASRLPPASCPPPSRDGEGEAKRECVRIWGKDGFAASSGFKSTPVNRAG